MCSIAADGGKTFLSLTTQSTERRKEDESVAIFCFPFTLALCARNSFSSSLSLSLSTAINLHRKKSAHKYMQKTITGGITCYFYFNSKIYGAFFFLFLSHSTRYFYPPKKKIFTRCFLSVFVGPKLDGVDLKDLDNKFIRNYFVI